MPNVYRDLLNGVSVGILPSALQQVPGGIILQSLRPPGDVRALFDAFCRYFRLRHPWTWIGSAVTPSAGDILDGVRNTGQCSALAVAFRTLATRPLM